MVIANDTLYKEFINAVKRQGARVQYETEPATCILDNFGEIGSEYVGKKMRDLLPACGLGAAQVIKEYFGISPDDRAIDLFLGLSLIEKGDCPDCGGHLEYIDYETDDEGRILNIYGCPVCGYSETIYDAEATREARATAETYKTLMYER